MSYTSTNFSGLPDPYHAGEFYADVPTKRFVAWIIDTVITAVITLLIVPFTAFTALFFLPFLYLVVNFTYRTIALARRSATPGMRLTSIELRTYRGETFDLPTASLHTLGYAVSVSMVLPQIISIILICVTPRAQSLSDMILGTAAINRTARY